MRDRNALVTRDVTGESQYPVPTRPYPTRPALYIRHGETSIHSVTNATREATSPSAPTTPTAWMGKGR